MFTVFCPMARERGAIGIFYVVTTTIEAKDRAEAEKKWRDKYDSLAPPEITETDTRKMVGGENENCHRPKTG